MPDLSTAFGAGFSTSLDGLTQIDEDLKQIVTQLGSLAAASGITGDALTKMAQQTSQALDKLGNGTKTVQKNTQNAANGLGKIFAPVEKGFTTMITGMLKGTMTWQQAMNRGIQAMLSAELQADAKFLQSRIKTALGIQSADEKSAQSGLLAWLSAESAKTNATEAGTAARTQAENAGQSTGLLQTVENALKAIGVDAGKVFADVFAFFAPSMGPAAAAPAGAAQAAVLAASQLVAPGLAVGAWDVPRDMPAYIHRGEAVLPVDFATGLRAAASGGGSRRAASGDMHLHVHAMDARGVRQFLLDNHAAVGEAMQRAWRNGNPKLR